jgi:membrane protease YdiL (CAAX protease family)
MQLPGQPSLIFLAYLFVFLPVVAFRTARVLRAARAGDLPKALPRRETIWIRTIVNLGVLLLLSWLVARGFDYDLFAVPPLGGRQVAMAATALVASLGLRQVLRALRPEEERRRLMVYFLAPRSPREWVWAIAAILVASVAEEAAYRGVGMAILWYWLGNPWLAATLCAIAFALAHWMQGFKSGVFIFALAFVMHALCVLTGTLVLAMVVHALYDFVAAALIARDAKQLGAGEPAAA